MLLQGLNKVRRIVFNEFDGSNLTDAYYYNLGIEGLQEEVSQIPEEEGLKHVKYIIEKHNFSDNEIILNEIFDKEGYWKHSFRYTVAEFKSYYPEVFAK